MENAHGGIGHPVQVKRYDGYNIGTSDTARRYSPGKCASIRTKRICGNPARADIITSHAERLNLSLRHCDKRFTRLTPCYSKKLENLTQSVALTVAYFNFCRINSSLKVKATADTKAIERTPATAAGVADHVRTMEELLSAAV